MLEHLPIKPDWRPTKNTCCDGSKAKSSRCALRRAGERDRYASFLPITEETLEIGCKYGAEGIQNFLKGEARKNGEGASHPNRGSRRLH